MSLPAALRRPQKKHAPVFLKHVSCGFSNFSSIVGPSHHPVVYVLAMYGNHLKGGYTPPNRQQQLGGGIPPLEEKELLLLLVGGRGRPPRIQDRLLLLGGVDPPLASRQELLLHRVALPLFSCASALASVAGPGLFHYVFLSFSEGFSVIS